MSALITNMLDIYSHIYVFHHLFMQYVHCFIVTIPICLKAIWNFILVHSISFDDLMRS